MSVVLFDELLNKLKHESLVVFIFTFYIYLLFFLERFRFDSGRQM